jgi:hypothetical protein
LENRIKNIKGRSTSSEEAPEYFGAKRRLSLNNENIMCDICYKHDVTMKINFCEYGLLIHRSTKVQIGPKSLSALSVVNLSS